MLLRFTLSRTVRMLLIAALLGVCLVPLRAQDSSARVITRIGQLSVSTDGRDMLALSDGMSIKPQQVIVTGPDGYGKFQVSDGSTFEVFSDARVVFRPTPGSWTELLNLVLGRVKVIITHPNGRPNPNQVSSPTAVISVRGTVFDVVVEDADGTTLVMLDEGLVDVQNRTAPGGAVRLNPGEYVRVFRNQQLAAAKPYKGFFLEKVRQGAEDALRQVLLGQRPSGGAAGPGSVPVGPQGDKGKPTPPPGAPPAPPGGGN
jgi:hypothetical protein